MGLCNQKRRNQSVSSFPHCTIVAGALLSYGSMMIPMCLAYSTSWRQRHSFIPKASISSRRDASFGVSYHHVHNIINGRRRLMDKQQLYIYPPPGSAYHTREEEEDELPDTYEPMLEYPGTMRPGRTPENMPFHDLPIGDDDPDPVPWPHFQQIEWHHQWEPPHPHPTPIEDYIEQIGRWATPEMEAAMRAGARRGVKERREAAEEEKKSSVIMDDDDDEGPEDVPVNIGDGVFGQLGSIAEESATAAAVKPPAKGKEITDEEEDSDDFGDFLLDLGLDDTGDGDDDAPASSKSKRKPSSKAKASDDDDDDDIDLDLDLGLLDDIDDGSGGNKSDDGDDSDDDIDIDLSLDVEDEIEVTTDDEGVQMVPLEDFDDEEDSSLDDEDAFDDLGLDY